LLLSFFFLKLGRPPTPPQTGGGQTYITKKCSVVHVQTHHHAHHPHLSTDSEERRGGKKNNRPPWAQYIDNKTKLMFDQTTQKSIQPTCLPQVPSSSSLSFFSSWVSSSLASPEGSSPLIILVAEQSCYLSISAMAVFITVFAPASITSVFLQGTILPNIT
jgi:hypothetical protein